MWRFLPLPPNPSDRSDPMDPADWLQYRDCLSFGRVVMVCCTQSNGDIQDGPQPGFSGVARWQRRGDAWEPVSYVPVAHHEDNVVWIEPSLVRDVDDSLLFTSGCCCRWSAAR